MAGALMQLVAYGAQDVYLTSEPTITFWKAVYRRHTNFAMESIAQTLSGSVGFNQTVICRVSRNGDLMGRTWVEVKVTTGANELSAGNAVNRVGFALLKRVELRIGGQMIDRILSTWMYIWTELTHTTDQKTLLNSLVGGDTGNGASNTTETIAANTTKIYNIPLLFAYCRHPGLAIPLIALQYHEVEIQIEFDTLTNTFTSGCALSGAQVWVDYIFLDTDERKEFAQKPHEYLIETVQSQTLGLTSGDNRLTFNHPTKFLAWVGQLADPNGDSFTDFGDHADTGTVPCLTNSQLKLNGQDRFATRANDYFNRVQPYQHFSGNPCFGINVYSFAVKPEEHQPSGTCNFSRIDNTNLTITRSANANTLQVFALSYNVFRVASGMGGLAYSN